MAFRFAGNRLFNLLSSVLYVVLNALPLAFLGLYLRGCYGPVDAAAERAHRPGGSLEEYCDRFGISPRERDIVRLVCKGYANKQIADKLCISVSTVKDHNHHIFPSL